MSAVSAVSSVRLADTPQTLVVFRVGPVWLSASVEAVEGVIPRPETIAVAPQAAPCVTGFFDHRGETATVVDLHCKLGLGGEGGSHLVMVRGEAGLLAFAVDDLQDVASAERFHWAAPPTGVPPELFLATLSRDNRLILHTDFFALYRFPGATSVAAWVAHLRALGQVAPAASSPVPAVSEELDAAPVVRPERRAPSGSAVAQMPEALEGEGTKGDDGGATGEAFLPPLSCKGAAEKEAISSGGAAPVSSSPDRGRAVVPPATEARVSQPPSAVRRSAREAAARGGGSPVAAGEVPTLREALGRNAPAPPPPQVKAPPSPALVVPPAPLECGEPPEPSVLRPPVRGSSQPVASVARPPRPVRSRRRGRSRNVAPSAPRRGDWLPWVVVLLLAAVVALNFVIIAEVSAQSGEGRSVSGHAAGGAGGGAVLSSGLAPGEAIGWSAVAEMPAAGWSDAPYLPWARPLEGLPPPFEPSRLRVHVVHHGETLWGLAQRLLDDPWRYRELARFSNIRDPDLILPGEFIYFPVAAAGSSND